MVVDYLPIHIVGVVDVSLPPNISQAEQWWTLLSEIDLFE
jgi:hypothetical protein